LIKKPRQRVYAMRTATLLIEDVGRGEGTELAAAIEIYVQNVFSRSSYY
jgi:hypothetical protein